MFHILGKKVTFFIPFLHYYYAFYGVVRSTCQCSSHRRRFKTGCISERQLLKKFTNRVCVCVCICASYCVFVCLSILYVHECTHVSACVSSPDPWRSAVRWLCFSYIQVWSTNVWTSTLISCHSRWKFVLYARLDSTAPPQPLFLALSHTQTHT